MALADGTISVAQFRALQNLSSLMLQCSRLAADEFSTDQPEPNSSFVASILNDNDDKDDHAELPSPKSNR